MKSDKNKTNNSKSTVKDKQSKIIYFSNILKYFLVCALSSFLLSISCCKTTSKISTKDFVKISVISNTPHDHTILYYEFTEIVNAHGVIIKKK